MAIHPRRPDDPEKGAASLGNSEFSKFDIPDDAHPDVCGHLKCNIQGYATSGTLEINMCNSGIKKTTESVKEVWIGHNIHVRTMSFRTLPIRGVANRKSGATLQRMLQNRNQNRRHTLPELDKKKRDLLRLRISVHVSHKNTTRP